MIIYTALIFGLFVGAPGLRSRLDKVTTPIVVYAFHIIAAWQPIIIQLVGNIWILYRYILSLYSEACVQSSWDCILVSFSPIVLSILYYHGRFIHRNTYTHSSRLIDEFPD